MTRGIRPAVQQRSLERPPDHGRVGPQARRGTPGRSRRAVSQVRTQANLRSQRPAVGCAGIPVVRSQLIPGAGSRPRLGHQDGDRGRHPGPRLRSRVREEPPDGRIEREVDDGSELQLLKIVGDVPCRVRRPASRRPRGVRRVPVALEARGPVATGAGGCPAPRFLRLTHGVGPYVIATLPVALAAACPSVERARPGRATWCRRG